MLYRPLVYKLGETHKDIYHNMYNMHELHAQSQQQKFCNSMENMYEFPG